MKERTAYISVSVLVGTLWVTAHSIWAQEYPDELSKISGQCTVGLRSTQSRMQSFDETVTRVESEATTHQSKNSTELPTPCNLRNMVTKFEADYRSGSSFDPAQCLIVDPVRIICIPGEAKDVEFIPVFKRRSFIDGICFGSWSFDDFLTTLD